MNPQTPVDRLASSVRRGWTLLGDPAALSTTTALVYLPYGLVGPLLIDRQRLGGSGLAWLALGLAGQAVLMIDFAIARSIIGRFTPTRSTSVANLVAMIIGVVMRGCALALLAITFGMTTSWELGYRIGSALIAQLGVLVLIAIVVSTYEGHRRLANDLESQRRQLASTVIATKAQADLLRSQIREQVSTTIAPLLDQLDQVLRGHVDADALTRARQSIRQVVDDELRPLSHRLESGEGLPQSVIEAPVIGQRVRVPLPSSLAMGKLLRPLLMGLVAALLVTSQAVRALSGVSVLTFPMVTGIVVCAGLWIVRALISRWEPPLWLGVATSAAVAAFLMPMALMVQAALALPVPTGIITAAVVAGAIVGTLISLGVAVDARRVSTENQMRESVEQLTIATSLLRQEVFVTQRHLGYVIHGSIQSALYAAAMKLASDQVGSTDNVYSARMDILTAVTKLDALNVRGSILVDTLADIAELWDDSCVVRWTIDHKTVRLLAEYPHAAVSAGEIARECVSNAIRHGSATEVWVTISQVNGHVQVTAVDNGNGVDDSRHVGLGSRMLDEVCISWHRESSDRGTAVVAELATGGLLVQP